jgi:hypothetical protein
MCYNNHLLLLFIGTTDASSVVMTASCLCTVVLDLTSEEFLLSCPGFDTMTLKGLSDLIVNSLQQVIGLYLLIGAVM